MPDTLLFLSPGAGSNGDKIVQAFAKLDRNGVLPHKRITLEPGETDVRNCIANNRPERVVVAGGDGSVNYVARAMLGSDIPLGIFPAGPANGLATELRLPNRLDDAMKAWIQGEALYMDAIKVNDGKWWRLHFADFGMNAKLVRHADEHDTNGMFGYFTSFLQTVSTEDGMTFSVETEAGEVIVDAVMIAVANAGKLGTGAILYPKGNLHNGKMGVLTFHPFRNWELVQTTIAFFRGSVDQLKNVTHSEQNWVKITPHGEVPLQIDGEIIETDDATFKFEVRPKALKVLVPKRS